MSMCYLCDLCRRKTLDIVGDEWCNALGHYLANDKPKLAIDYGRDNPKEICEHFKRNEV